MTAAATAEELLRLAEVDVKTELPKEQYGPVLARPPFVSVEGTFNSRDIGLLPGSPVRPGLAYRSGALAQLTVPGRAVVAGPLGVRRVFDLRSAEERDRAPDPPLLLPGGQCLDSSWAAPARPDARIDLARFVSGGGEQGYREMYLDVIDAYRASWRAVLEHVRDRPGEPFLFHCTAGRDRTGVCSALLLSLAGAPDETISLDYMLSRIGTEPVRAMLLKVAVAGSGAEGEEPAGFYNLCSLRASCWAAFVEGVKEEYGGFDKFVVDRLGFTPEDVATIRSNLTRPQGQN